MKLQKVSDFDVNLSGGSSVLEEHISANFDALDINCYLTVAELEPSRALNSFRFRDI